MIRGLPTTIFAAMCAGAVGVGLFFIKHEVKEQEARLAELNQEIQRNQEVIHVLKAEWSYLNDPARLRALSEKFLSMKVMGPTQIVTLNSLPAAGPVYAARQAPKTLPAPAAAQAAPAIAKAEPVKPAPAPVAVAKAAPAPLPPSKAPAAQPGKPLPQPAATKLAQSPAPQKTPGVYSPPPLIARPLPAPQPGPVPGQQPGPGRSIVIQSPAIAETPGYPGEVR